jgi:hypothetical protein
LTDLCAKLDAYAAILASIKNQLNTQPLYKNASSTVEEMYTKLDTLKY